MPVPTGQQGGEAVHTVAAFSVRCSGTLEKNNTGPNRKYVNKDRCNNEIISSYCLE